MEDDRNKRAVDVLQRLKKGMDDSAGVRAAPLTPRQQKALVAALDALDEEGVAPLQDISGSQVYPRDVRLFAARKLIAKKKIVGRKTKWWTLADYLSLAALVAVVAIAGEALTLYLFGGFRLLQSGDLAFVIAVATSASVLVALVALRTFLPALAWPSLGQKPSEWPPGFLISTVLLGTVFFVAAGLLAVFAYRMYESSTGMLSLPGLGMAAVFGAVLALVRPLTAIAHRALSVLRNPWATVTGQLLLGICAPLALLFGLLQWPAFGQGVLNVTLAFLCAPLVAAIAVTATFADHRHDRPDAAPESNRSGWIAPVIAGPVAVAALVPLFGLLPSAADPAGSFYKGESMNDPYEQESRPLQLGVWARFDVEFRQKLKLGAGQKEIVYTFPLRFAGAPTEVPASDQFVCVDSADSARCPDEPDRRARFLLPWAIYALELGQKLTPQTEPGDPPRGVTFLTVSTSEAADKGAIKTSREFEALLVKFGPPAKDQTAPGDQIGRYLVAERDTTIRGTAVVALRKGSLLRITSFAAGAGDAFVADAEIVSGLVDGLDVRPGPIARATFRDSDFAEIPAGTVFSDPTIMQVIEAYLDRTTRSGSETRLRDDALILALSIGNQNLADLIIAGRNLPTNQTDKSQQGQMSVAAFITGYEKTGAGLFAYGQPGGQGADKSAADIIPARLIYGWSQVPSEDLCFSIDRAGLIGAELTGAGDQRNRKPNWQSAVDDLARLAGASDLIIDLTRGNLQKDPPAVTCDLKTSPQLGGFSRDVFVPRSAPYGQRISLPPGLPPDVSISVQGKDDIRILHGSDANLLGASTIDRDPGDSLEEARLADLSSDGSGTYHLCVEAYATSACQDSAGGEIPFAALAAADAAAVPQRGEVVFTFRLPGDSAITGDAAARTAAIAGLERLIGGLDPANKKEGFHLVGGLARPGQGQIGRGSVVYYDGSKFVAVLGEGRDAERTPRYFLGKSNEVEEAALRAILDYRATVPGRSSAGAREQMADLLARQGGLEAAKALREEEDATPADARYALRLRGDDFALYRPSLLPNAWMPVFATGVLHDDPECFVAGKSRSVSFLSQQAGAVILAALEAAADRGGEGRAGPIDRPPSCRNARPLTDWSAYAGSADIRAKLGSEADPDGYLGSHFYVVTDDREGTHSGFLTPGTVLRGLSYDSTDETAKFDVILGTATGGCTETCWVGLSAIAELGATYDPNFDQLPQAAYDADAWTDTSEETYRSGSWIDRRAYLGLPAETVDPVRVSEPAPSDVRGPPPPAK